MTKRLWIIGLFLLAGALALPLVGSGQGRKANDELTKLTEDIYVYRHLAHQALVITTSEGVIVTDPISQDAATWLKAEIRTLTSQPVRYVIYSHDHADHISGGIVYDETATFVSHRRAREVILAEKRLNTPVPQITFTDRLFIDLGGKRIEVIHVGKNHSDNSVVVYLPQDKLLFAVDFIPIESVAYRTMRDSYPEEWINSLRQVEQLDFEILVPGHGMVGRKEHARMFREYLEDLLAGVAQYVMKGASLEETKQALRLPKYEKWNGYPDWFIENVEAMYGYISLHRPQIRKS
ncbi:MAG: MBL fold metallo-hydrolase [Nitrospiraceae bacterium]